MPVTSVSKAARYRRAASVIFPMPPDNEKRAGTTPGPFILLSASRRRWQRRTKLCIQHALRRRGRAAEGAGGTAKGIRLSRSAKRGGDRRPAECLVRRGAAERFLRCSAAESPAFAQPLAEFLLVERMPALG